MVDRNHAIPTGMEVNYVNANGQVESVGNMFQES